MCGSLFAKCGLAALLICYMTNSALMLVANKLAVHMFPASSTVSTNLHVIYE